MPLDTLSRAQPLNRDSVTGTLAVHLQGKLCEASWHGHDAVFSLAFSLVKECQTMGEPAAWLSLKGHLFFPPDAADSGVDLNALPLVRLETAQALGRAADQLARSGAFGLLVIDLSSLKNAELPAPLITRLLGLGQKHRCTLLFLTHKPKEAPSLSPLIGVRMQTSRRRIAPGKFACVAEGVKDKFKAPGWKHEEVRRGPPGLR